MRVYVIFPSKVVKKQLLKKAWRASSTPPKSFNWLILKIN